MVTTPNRGRTGRARVRSVLSLLIAVALAYPTLMWVGERFDASPTMRDNVPTTVRPSNPETGESDG